MILVVTAGISASLMAVVRYSALSQYTANDGLEYSPTDTRIITISHSNARTLCQALELRVTEPIPYSYDAYLISLESPSFLNLTGRETFSFSEQPYIATGDRQYYYYYMYPGSVFNMSACLLSENHGFGFFYLLKGKNNFTKWLNNDYSDFRPLDNFTIIFNCTDERSNRTHTYDVLEEDYYFLAYDGDDFTDIQLQVYASFYRTYYELSSMSTLVDSCKNSVEYSNASCSIDVPWSHELIYFLFIVPDSVEGIDWTQKIGLDTVCIPRIGMYAVMGSAVFTALVVFSTSVLVCMMCCIGAYKKTTPTVAADRSRAPRTTNSRRWPDYGASSYY